MMKITRKARMQRIPIFDASDFTVTSGANIGDSLSVSDDLSLDDIYQMHPLARRRQLTVMFDEHGIRVGKNGDVGQFLNTLVIDCMITLMSTDGATVEALLLVEIDRDDMVAGIYVMALSMISPKSDYSLIGIDTDVAEERFAQIACVSFTKGTHITMSDGSMRKIEDLEIGDDVMTRDAGIQKIRWIGHNTMRATGDFAPVLIKKGALHNARDLMLSPDHRLFVYQRADKLGLGRAEVLVRAKHLINGDTVRQMTTAHVDYYQILFDDHHIIYAEGIAAESMLFDQRTHRAIPQDSSTGFPLQDASLADAIEAPDAAINRPNMVALLKSASLG